LFAHPEVAEAFAHFLEIVRHHSRAVHHGQAVIEARLASLETDLEQVKRILLMLDPAVQKIVDDAPKVAAALDALLAALGDVKGQLAAATVKVAPAIDAEDLAALQSAGSALDATIAKAQAALAPTPVAAPADAATAAPGGDRVR
jgi:hypothetical protein